MRKAFNFFRSYFEVYKKLNDKDKVAFIDALLMKQFHDVDPELEGMAEFAYLSQKHNIDQQVQGYKDKTKRELEVPIEAPSAGGSQGGAVGGSEAPSVQGKEKEKEKVKGKGLGKGKDIPELQEFGSYVCKMIEEKLQKPSKPYRKSIALKYESWKENGWKDGNNRPIKNWKSKVLNVIQYLEAEEGSEKIDYKKYLQ